MAAVDDGIEAALLRYLLDVDLVTTVEWAAAPLDHPFRWRLADSRALDVTRELDHLWLRPLDVARPAWPPGATRRRGPRDRGDRSVRPRWAGGSGSRAVAAAPTAGARCQRPT